MYTAEERERYGVDLLSGHGHYRAYTGGSHDFSLYGAGCFALLSSLGMREHHYVLDIGCGSMRAGRVLLAFLLTGRYAGLDPNEANFRQAIDEEVGWEQWRMKRAAVAHNDQFEFPSLDQPYDFVLSHAIFTHAALSQIDQCLGNLAEVMSPDGVLAATYCPIPFLSRQHESTTVGWSYPDLTYFHPKTIARVARNHGFAFTPIGWDSFCSEVAWALFTRSAQPPSQRPEKRWRAPLGSVSRPKTNLCRRVLQRLGLVSRQPNWFPGTEAAEPKASDD